MGRVYAIASAKGGVGKTTTTANLGTTLAAAGHRVAVVDADIGMPNLGRMLDITPDGPTLHDVLAGDADPLDAVYEGPHGLAVVPGATSLDAYSRANPRRLERVVDALADYDLVLVDTGAGLSHDTLLPLSLADAVVLVSTPSPDALGDTEKTRQLAERVGAPIAGLVLTRVETASVDPDALTADFDVDLLDIVPEDRSLGTESDAEGTTVTPDADTPAAVAYRALAGSLTAGAMRVEFDEQTDAVEADDESEPVGVDDTEPEAEVVGQGEDAAETDASTVAPSELDVSSLLDEGAVGVDELDVSELLDEQPVEVDEDEVSELLDERPIDVDEDEVSELFDAAASEAGASGHTDEGDTDSDADTTETDSNADTVDAAAEGAVEPTPEPDPAPSTVDADDDVGDSTSGGGIASALADAEAGSDTGADDVDASVADVVTEAEPDAEPDVTVAGPPDDPGARHDPSDVAGIPDAETDPGASEPNAGDETELDEAATERAEVSGDDDGGDEGEAAPEDAPDENKGLFRRFFG